jgi:dTMP kinase
MTQQFMPLLRFGKTKPEPKNYGRLIVLDGIDGSGKSTQLKLLERELELNNYKIQTIHFPQHGSRSAAMVDDYLAGKFGQINPYAASAFYAIDRFEAGPRIREWLKEGKVVLCDRYVTANVAHQGGKIPDHMERLKFFKWLDNLEYTVFGIPKPDLNIILNLPADVSAKLLKMRTEDQGHIDNMHEPDKKHLRHSQQVYTEIARLFPNTKLVECVQNNELLPPDQIHNKVWDFVRRIALKDFKA